MLQKGVFCLIDFGEAPQQLCGDEGPIHGLNYKYLPARINNSFKTSVGAGEGSSLRFI